MAASFVSWKTQKEPQGWKVGDVLDPGQSSKGCTVALAVLVSPPPHTPLCFSLLNGCDRLNWQTSVQHSQEAVTSHIQTMTILSSHTTLSLESSLGPWVPPSSSTAMRTAEDACVLSVTGSQGCEPSFCPLMLCIHCMEVPKLGFWITVSMPAYRSSISQPERKLKFGDGSAPLKMVKSPGFQFIGKF